MENLVLSFNIVMPLFLLMAVGYFAKRIHLIDGPTGKALNNLVFRIFLPVLLFRNVATSTIETVMRPGVFIYAAIAVSIEFLLLFVLVPRLEPVREKCGVLIQGIARSNYALFGIPVVEAIFPGGDTSVASVMVAVIVPVLNVFAVIALETYRGGKADFRKIAKSIVKNPLIISTLLGLVALLLGVKLPTVLDKATNDLGKVATPLALFVLGSSFEFKALSGNKIELLVSVPAKLLFSPLLFAAPAALLGFRGVEFASVLIAFAAPAAVNSFTMAQQIGGDAELAGQHVVLTSAFSAVTVFLLIFLSKQLGLF